MRNALDQRIRRLERKGEQADHDEIDFATMDRKHLARVIWHIIHAPRRNDTEARLKRRWDLIMKLLHGEGWSEEEAAEFHCECDDILPESKPYRI